MIPDVTPNGVFYLPPTGWLTSFYNPPLLLFVLPHAAKVRASNGVAIIKPNFFIKDPPKINI